MRVVHFAATLLFFFAAALQYNDPDALRWMLIYGLAGIAAIRVAAGKNSWFLAGGVGAVALGWATVLLPRVWRSRPTLGSLFEWRMNEPGSEEARELAGLLMVVAWMAVIMISQRPRRRPATSSQGQA